MMCLPKGGWVGPRILSITGISYWKFMSFFVTSQTLSTLARNNRRRSQSRLFTQMKPLTNHDLSSRSTVPPANDWNGFLPRHEMLSVELRLLQEFPDLGLFKMRYGALQPAAQLPSAAEWELPAFLECAPTSMISKWSSMISRTLSSRTHLEHG